MKRWTRAVVLATACGCIAWTTLNAEVQGPSSIIGKSGPLLAFEVVSVKRSAPDARGRMVSGPAPSRFTTRNATALQLLMYSEGVREYQIQGAPDWATTEGFDIEATYPGGATVDAPSVRRMVRTLLEDRFRLKTHQETRDAATFDLVMARQDGRVGPNLRRSDIDCEALLAETKARGRPPDLGPSDIPPCMMFAMPQAIRGGSRSISMLATTLSVRVGRLVTDRTGLAGNFDINLEWAPDALALPSSGTGARAEEPPVSADAVSIFTALQEQLGLRLVSARGLMETVVVESLERPSPD